MQSYIPIFLLTILIHSTINETWNYHDLGPDVWSDTYPLCAKHSQSPINIRTACTTYQTFTPFQFSSNSNLTKNFTLLNDGHTIIGKYIGNNSSYFKLSGGGLNGTFDFLNFHLHWGENYKSGSEHQINGVKYAGEIHFVYINPSTYQIAVLGIFMDSKPNITPSEDLTIAEWRKYFAEAGRLKYITNSTVFNLNLALLMGTHLKEFWRYVGSLTTPPCTEGIIWTLFKTPIMFTENEIGSFRENILFQNYRSPQPLYDRFVYRNFLNETLSSISDYNCCWRNLYNTSSYCFDYFHLLLYYFLILSFYLT